ncbi:MAG: hypothetical protein HN842_03465 [Gammaproteobacteria bacterium]|jgi:hypothetical protein|nr:hypothetical protein [Gammaproteobacteria bacterium]
MQRIHTVTQPITQQQELLCSWVATPMKTIAEHCAKSWSKNSFPINSLADALQESMKQIPQSVLCYLISLEGTVLSPSISFTTIDPSDQGKDVSQRPYFMEWDGKKDFFLSRLYTSTKTNLTCMTALQTVRIEGEIVALIAVDFDNSQNSCSRITAIQNHTQIKGDPSIRQQLFQQTRTITPMEEQIDAVHQLMNQLLLNHGVFYIEMKYSRSTATIRFIDYPYHDPFFTMEKLISANFSETLSKEPFSALSSVSDEQIMPVLKLFKSLRLADENIYLRSASLNIITGMVELNFSCDGTHYLPVADFLEKSSAFWLSNPVKQVKPPSDNTFSTVPHGHKNVPPPTPQPLH